MSDIRSYFENFFYKDSFPFFNVVLSLTNSCQCDCIHCGVKAYKKTPGRELGLAGVKGILDALSEKKTHRMFGKKPARVIFFGGEPLLRKDLLPLIAYATKRGLETSLNTNGYLLTRDKVREFKKAGLGRVCISIDSPDPATHDAYRGLENCFERAVGGIQICADEGLVCAIATYATGKNLRNGDLEKIISLGKKLGADFTQITPAVMAGELQDAGGVRLSPGENRRLLRLCGKHECVYLESYRCTSLLKKFVFISPCGEVQPCPYIPLSFGNVKSAPLAKILGRMWEHPMFGIKLSKGRCLMNDEKFREEYLKPPLPARLPIRLVPNHERYAGK